MLLRPLRPLLASVLDPTTLTLTGWYRGSYSGSPWSGTASAGASGSRSIEAGSAPSTGSAVNGFTPANFVAASSHYLLDGTNLADAYISTTAYRVVMLVKLTSSAAPAGAIYDDRGLVTEGGGNWGIVYNTSGVHCYHYDGAYQVASSASAVATGGWHIIDVQYNGTNLTVSVDGTAGTPVAAGTLGSVAAAFRVGTNYGPAVYADAQIMEVILASSDLSATTAAAFKGYVNSRYALSL